VPGSLGCGSEVFAAMMMLAPSRAARRAMALPMPRLAPLMKMVFPLRVDIGGPYHDHLLVDLLPPLTPPVGTNQDAQLRVPAIRKLGVGLEIEETVVALLAAIGHALENVVRDHVLEFESLFLVDLFGFRSGK